MSDSGFRELPVISSGPIAHNPSAADPIVGIDLGTTNSLVAIVTNGPGSTREPVIIPTLEGSNLLPSIVHCNSSGTFDVGFAAKRFRTLDPKNTLYSVKRLLGKGRHDIAPLREHLPYDLEASSDSNIQIQTASRSMNAIEVSALLLKELKKAAETHLGREVEDAVITVPAYFNDSQRQATRAAGRLAGFNVLRVLNEPTAASLAYGIQKKKDGLIAVYDLGGGTFDVSVLRLKDGVFEVLATNGDTALGGDDLDAAILAWCLQRVAETLPHAELQDASARAALLDRSETAKKALSTAESAEIQLDLYWFGVANKTEPLSATSLALSLTRKDLEMIARPILERTSRPVRTALADAGVDMSELTDVVLVGGPTRLQAVRDFVTSLFGREPNCSLHPDEVVALGAAVQADILAGNNRDLLLLDVVPLSLGIETFGGTMNKLIQRNTRIPALAKEQFTTYVEGQTKVAINVYQGEREQVKDNRMLGQFVLSGIPPLPAGVARIEVTFLVDADGILGVSAREMYSEIEASIEVRPQYGLTDAEVERMLADGLENRQRDIAQAKLQDARNDAQTILTATEKSLQSVGSALSASEHHQIRELARTLHEALRKNELAVIREAHQALDRGTRALAQLLMNQTFTKELTNKSVKDILGGSQNDPAR